MSEKPARQKIIDYYDKNQRFYSKSAMSTHCGLWDEKTRTLDEANLNTNRVVAEYLDLKSTDKVLDAGCGVGGTSIYLAENYGVEVIGIAIVESQLELAEEYKARSSQRKNITFLNKDYTRTGFASESFDKIFGLESVCYASDKKEFLAEAYRLLKPGGRLVVLDAYLNRAPATRKEQKLYRDLIQGFALENYAELVGFAADMDDLGFKNIYFEDKMMALQRSRDYYYRVSSRVYPFLYVLDKLRIYTRQLPDTLIGHVRALIRIKTLIERGIIIYGIFVAEKGFNPRTI